MLYLYKNVLPNLNAKHYYFISKTAYKLALESNLVESINIDNYRINTNIIKVKLSQTLTDEIADTLTYAIDERDGYFRAYHVNRTLLQSGYVILNCSVDLWATYFYKATFSNINVLRCNRNINVGLLDEIAGTRDAPTCTYCAVDGRSSGDNNELYDVTQVYGVFALKYNIQQNNAGSVSRIKLFAVRLDDLKRRLFEANKVEIHDDDTEAVKQQKRLHNFYYSSVNAVDLVQDFIAGIYGITGFNMWDISGTLNAVVLGAWITDLVACVGQDNVEVKSKANWKNFNDVTLKPFEVISAQITRNLVINNNFNKQLYIGTMQNGLKLQRTTEASINVTLKCIPSIDKLTIIAMQGDNQEDITQAFSLTLGTTDGDITAERQALDVIQNSIKYFGAGLALAKGVASGNALASVIGIQGVASTIAGNVERSQHIGNMVKGGDGAVAFYRINAGTDMDNPYNNITTPITNPYIINAYNSINDENVNVRLYGAKFSEKVASIYSIFNASYLGTGNNDDPTLIQASCNIDGIPTEASDLIKGKLQTGVYVVRI